MLIRLVTLVRRSASDSPVERCVAIDPESIIRIEEAAELGLSWVWCDGMTDRPYMIRGTVDEVLTQIQDSCEALCGPVDSDTE